MNRTILMCALPLLMLASCKREQSPEKRAVTDATIVANPVEGRPSAAYFTVHGGEQPAQLTGVTVEGAQKAEMHRTMNNKGMMSMEPMTAVSVPAGGTVEFKQGGNHVMVFGLPNSAINSEMAAMSFSFSDGQTVNVEAKVSKAGQQNGEHGDAH